MRRHIVLLLLLALALSAVCAAAEDGETTFIDFPELSFTTLADFDCIAQVEGDRELFLYTGTVESMPYYYIWLDDGPDRITDGQAYIDDVMIPGFEDLMDGDRPSMLGQRGDFTLGGRAMANIEAEFWTRAGNKVCAVSAVDVREDYTVLYGIRCGDPALADDMLRGLDTLASELRYTGAAQAETTPQADAPPLNFTVNAIKYAGETVGRCCAPEGWEIAPVITYGQSIEEPWTLTLTAAEPGGAMMAYVSAQVYIEILRMDSGETHQDGVYNPLYHVPMLYYKDAAAYCDYTATQIAPEGAKLARVSDNSFPEAQALLDRKEQAALAKANAHAGASGVGVDAVECTVCMRRYTVDYPGGTACVCVMAGVEALQSTARRWGPLAEEVSSLISWKPVFCYSIVCPAERWGDYEPVFLQFVENSGTSDQFNAANDRLCTELLGIIGAGIDLAGGQGYSEEVLRGEAASGDDYTDRYSDYLFDQNDYTLSDGSHVKVSTAYDYVYQGDNGTVWYTDSAFPEPGVQLYPNR